MEFMPEGHNNKFPWLITILCPMCNTPKFMCSRSCTTGNKDRRKSKFYSNMKQVRRHHYRCHKPQQPSSDESMEHNDNDSNSFNLYQDAVSKGCILDDTSLSLSNSCDDDAPEYCVPVSGFDSELRTSITNHDSTMDIHHIETSPQVAIIKTTRDKFRKKIVQGNVLEAASLLVSQAAFQSTNLFNTNLPLPNIMLFLHLGKLVISSGLLDQYNLAKVLSILYPYADSCQQDWSPVPCTIAGFRSLFLNVSNSNSLVSILPIPVPISLPDGHCYTPFQCILEHALMMKQFKTSETKDPKW